MATYDLTQNIPTKIAAGDILNCPYSGAYKTVALPKGTYKLECWGAQGGSNSTTYYGGKGGYSVGTIILRSKLNVYLYTGGQGTGASTTSGIEAGGFNGGGDGYSTSSTYKEAGGGGASDIRIGSDSLYARVIVAGGGGGAGVSASSYKYCGGAGGGSTGITSESNSSYYGGTGGTQTEAGTSYNGTSASSNANTVHAGFGVGAGAGTLTGYQLSGGGGGWYGGGQARRAPGGGGSGYVYTSSTASNYPSGCLLNSSMYLTDANTIAGNASMPSTSGSTETGHEGNGYVRITVISVDSGLPFKMKVDGLIVEPFAGYVKVDGVWKEITKVYYKTNNNWNT